MKLLPILVVLLMNGCTKEKPVQVHCIDSSCDTTLSSRLEIVWKTHTHEDSQYNFSITPIIQENEIIFSKDRFFNEKLVFLDRFSGKINGIWDGQVGEKIYNAVFGHQKGILINNEINFFAVKSPNNFNLVYRINSSIENFGLGCGYIDDKFYISTTSKNETRSTLNQIDLNTVKKELIITSENKINGLDYNMIYTAPALWISPTKDSILTMLWIGETSINGAPDTKTYFVAYNLTKQNWQWKRLALLNSRGTTNLYQKPLLYNDIVYHMTTDSLYAIDMKSGEPIWTFTDPLVKHTPLTNLTPIWSQPAIINGKIYFQLEGYFYSLDAISGQLIYKKQYAERDYGRGASRLNYCDGVFYFTAGPTGGGLLYAIRASDGKLLMAEGSPNHGKPYYGSDANMGNSNGIAIDSDNKLLYVFDGFFAMCFKIPQW